MLFPLPLPPVRLPALQYSTVQYSTVQYSTVQYSTVQSVAELLPGPKPPPVPSRQFHVMIHMNVPQAGVRPRSKQTVLKTVYCTEPTASCCEHENALYAYLRTVCCVILDSTIPYTNYGTSTVQYDTYRYLQKAREQVGPIF
jgi:hypothetical protein